MTTRHLLAAFALPACAFADTAPSPAPEYGFFFKPVPLAERKSLNSNRPTQVDTAYTVDPGVLQFETGVLAYVSDRYTPDSSKFSSFSLGQTNIRLGLTENFEFQTLVTPYVFARKADAAGNVTKESGLGDTTLRAFYNLQGNDGKGLGIAILPFIKLPSNRSDDGLYGNRRVEGGFELPLAYALDDKTSLASAPGVSFDWNGTDGRDANPYGTLAVFRTITPDLAVFGEVFVKKFTGYGPDSVVGQFDIGAVYLITPNFSWDVAAYYGFTRAAPDWTLQTGFALRF